MRHGQNEVIRFSAAKLMLEWSEHEMRVMARKQREAELDREDEEDEPGISLRPEALVVIDALAKARFGGDKARAIEEALFAFGKQPPTPAPGATR
jgi:hypothetical protein